MKSYILLVTLLIIIFCHWSSASSTGVEQRKTSAMVQFIGRRLRNLWTWVWHKGKPEDNFVERCFGAARRLKIAIPMIIFKLGVIVTILAFLTIFSLKTLGLLLLLVLFNSTGFAAKWTHANKHAVKQWSPPQNVHLHVHSKDLSKEGHYITHSEEQGWYDKSEFSDTDYESLEDRLKKLNIYENYYNKHHG